MSQEVEKTHGGASSMWDRLRRLFVETRDGRDINRWDVAGLVLIGAGAAWGVIGLILGESPGGFGIFAIGFLILIRHHPGGG